MDHLHGSTAIGGICLVEDDRWPEEFRGNAFGGNVMTGRVNRNSLVYTGSSIPCEGRLTCHSLDRPLVPPGRPATADGAMYITDFYNRIISRTKCHSITPDAIGSGAASADRLQEAKLTAVTETGQGGT